MAGLRGTLAALVISSALVALPSAAQSNGFASLTHTVSVTVPARVKVSLASLSAPAPISASISSARANVNALSLTIKATQAWVLAIGSDAAVQSGKANTQWSRDGRSRYSALTAQGRAIASGVNSSEAAPVSMFFRSVDSASAQNPRGQAETVALTVSAP